MQVFPGEAHSAAEGRLGHVSKKCGKLRNFVNGEFSDVSDHFEITNPANGDLLGTAPLSGQTEADRAVEAARQAKKEWALKPAVERAAFLHEIAAGIRKRQDEIADVIVREQGKIPSLAKVEAGFTADYMDYMAEWARRIEGEVIASDRPGEHILLLRKPVGVVAGILPWNFPFFLIARKMAPALVTGNTVVVKPSKETPINCGIFAEIVSQTKLPAGVFNVVYGNGSFGSLLSHHPKINMVSFTGSVETGEKNSWRLRRPISQKSIWNWAEKHRPLFWRMRIWIWRLKPLKIPGLSIPDRYATARSGCTWKKVWLMSLRKR